MTPWPAFEGRLLRDADAMAPFLVDWRRRWHGRAMAVAQPETTDATATVIRWCAANRVAVVPQGGNTGLSGGCVPDGSGHSLVLSTARLNRIRALDASNDTLTAEAGCSLQAVREAAGGAGRLFPLALPSQGSCTIGGNLATNAGGTAVLRYGSARALCLGLEVVTADGRVWNGLRGLRKDNTGLDLRDLFIGAEGTLGIITAATLRLFPKPAGTAVAWVAVASPAQALTLLGRAQAMLGPALTAFELVGRFCLELVLRHFPGTADPLQAASPWYVLIEASDWADAARAGAALGGCLEAALGGGTVVDAAMAQSTAQASALWMLREHASDAQARDCAAVKHDIAVPVSAVPAFIAAVGPALQRVLPAARLALFGHLGDGNLHCNVLLPAGDEAAMQLLANATVHGLTAAHGGSISAEHGLGVLRAVEAARLKSPVELDMLCAIRDALDPLGIMNPGKGIGAHLRRAGRTEGRNAPCN